MIICGKLTFFRDKERGEAGGFQNEGYCSFFSVFPTEIILLGNDAGPLEDSEELVEKKHQLVKQKEAYKQLTGKDYDKAPKGRLRGLRRVVAAARSLRRKDKPGSTRSAKDPPTLQRHFSGDYPHMLDPVDEIGGYKHTAVRIPRRWEIFPNSNTPRELFTPEAFDAIVVLFKVLLCFILSCVLEHEICAYRFI